MGSVQAAAVDPAQGAAYPPNSGRKLAGWVRAPRPPETPLDGDSGASEWKEWRERNVKYLGKAFDRTVEPHNDIRRDMINNTIVITGGDGFIGKYVQQRLGELGIGSAVYDFSDNIMHDVLDGERFADFVNTHKPRAIIHLAGLLGTHELWDDPYDAAVTNIVGAINVAQAAADTQTKLVCIEQPHIWYNVYEATKMAARRILTGMTTTDEYPLLVDFVTAHNAYGPGQAYGEGHPQKIIPTFATKAWLGEPLPVWGTGGQKVNLVYAGDVADMLVQRAVTPHGEPHRHFNAGTNKLTTVGEVANFVVSHVQSVKNREGGDRAFRAPIVNLPMRRGEQPWVEYPEPDKSYPYRMNWQKLGATIDTYRPDNT